MVENNRNIADIHILQLKSSLNDIYPVTYTSAVYDSITGANLTTLLHLFNAIHLPYAGSSFATRNQLLEEQRRKGIIISYIDLDGNTITEKCVIDKSIDDTYWGLDENWQKIGDVIISGELTVGANGNWIVNGKDINVKAVGPKGDNGATPMIKLINNKLYYSYDNADWHELSENIASWLRWNATSADSQGNILGRLLISRDNSTWSNLSGDFINKLHISRYIGNDESLPTKNVAEGTIYAKGPTYAESDTLNENPIYRLWVYAWKNNNLAWQDNGEFTSIAAGIVQETGTSETEIMSQASVTKELITLKQEIGGAINIQQGTIKGLSTGLLEYLSSTTRTRVTYRIQDIESIRVVNNNYYISSYAIYCGNIPTSDYFGSAPSGGLQEINVKSVINSIAFVPEEIVVVIANNDNTDINPNSINIENILKINYSDGHIRNKIDTVAKHQNLKGVGAISFPSNSSIKIDSLSIYGTPYNDQRSFTHESLIKTHELDTGSGAGILALHEDGTAEVVALMSDLHPTDVILIRYLKSRGGICGGILYENYISSISIDNKKLTETIITSLQLITHSETIYNKIINVDTGMMMDSAYLNTSMLKKYYVDSSIKYIVTGRVGISGTNTAIITYYDSNNVYLGYKYRGEGLEIILENEPLDIMDNCSYIYVLGTHPDFSIKVEPNVLIQNSIENRILTLEGHHKDIVKYTIEKGSASGLSTGTLMYKELSNRYRLIVDNVNKIKKINVIDESLYKITLAAVFKGDIPTTEYFGQAVSSTIVTNIDVLDYISKSSDFIPEKIIVVVGRQDDTEFDISSYQDILNVELIETSGNVKPLNGRTIVILGDSSCDATNWNVWSRMLMQNKLQLGCNVFCPALRSSGWSELEKEPFNVQSQWNSVKNAIVNVVDPIIIITTGGNELDQLLLNYEDGLELCSTDTSNLNNPKEWAVQTMKNICEDKPGACIYLVSNFYATSPVKDMNRRLYREFLTALCDYFSCTLIDLTRNSQIRGYLENNADSNGYRLFTSDGVHAATSLGKNRIYKKIMSQILSWETNI